MVHKLKILPEYFEEVLKKNKTFELRKDDRNYKVGDKLRLLEVDVENENYTGRECTRTILYILKNVEKYGLKTGFLILAMK